MSAGSGIVGVAVLVVLVAVVVVVGVVVVASGRASSTASAALCSPVEMRAPTSDAAAATLSRSSWALVSMLVSISAMRDGER